MEAVAIEDPEKIFLEKDYLEGVSLLGRNADMDKDALEELATKYAEMALAGDDEEMKGNDYYNIIFVGSLGHLICGLSEETLSDVTSLDEDAAETMLTIVGSLKSCPSPTALKLFAEQVIKNF